MWELYKCMYTEQSWYIIRGAVVSVIPVYKYNHLPYNWARNVQVPCIQMGKVVGICAEKKCEN